MCRPWWVDERSLCGRVVVGGVHGGKAEGIGHDTGRPRAALAFIDTNRPDDAGERAHAFSATYLAAEPRRSVA